MPQEGTDLTVVRSRRDEASSSPGQQQQQQPQHGALKIQVQRLNLVKVLVQEQIEGVAALHFGLGSSAVANLALRKRLGEPGAPFGGLGFLDPQKNVAAAPEDTLVPPPFVTQDFARSTKLREFERCARGEPSMYFWALQPVYNAEDCCIACEVLLRCRNGADAAPYEDVMALMNPAASEEVCHVYAMWKATEVVNWILAVVKGHPEIRSLDSIAVNVRPSDLKPTAGVFQEVEKRLLALSPDDRELLLDHALVEVTEDQNYPEEMPTLLQTWRALGFRLACDDVIGELACEALGKRGQNFHITSILRDFVDHFDSMKVDMEWAGYVIFLSHPAYNRRPEIKSEVLRKAEEEDLVYVPDGKGTRSTGKKHSELLREFADWARDVLSRDKYICVELSVTPEDPSNKFALDRLKSAYDLDIFGEHKAHFRFQGGPTGPKAFEPDDLMQGAQVIRSLSGELPQASTAETTRSVC